MFRRIEDYLRSDLEVELQKPGQKRTEPEETDWQKLKRRIKQEDLTIVVRNVAEVIEHEEGK